MDNILEKELYDLMMKDQLRSLKTLTSPQGRMLIVDGKRMLNFSSNDYLSLAQDVRIKHSVIKAVKKWGIGSGASRLICGNAKEHEYLEKDIAHIKETQKALLFSSGYTANIGIISSLVGRGDVVFSDKLNHASIVDGIVLSRAKMYRYAHNDMDMLEFFLKKEKNFRRKFIITDTVFSMDGDVAPLLKIVQLAEKYQAWVMVDEAHAFGVLGKKGAGLVESLGLQHNVHVQMGTLSKAVGVMGGYVAGSRTLCDYLMNKARSFIFTTAQPSILAAAVRESLRIMKKEPWRREKVLLMAETLRIQLKQIGLNTLCSETPIVPIMVKENKMAVEWSRKLAQLGVFVPAIRPPTVPNGGARLRVTLTAAHTQRDIDMLVQCLKKCF